MPKFDIKYGYAADRVTMKCRIQLMIAPNDLRMKLGHPIPPGSNLIPVAIAMWNAQKGCIDDFSKVLSHHVGKLSTH